MPLSLLWQSRRGRPAARVAALALAGYLAVLGPSFWQLRLTDYGPLVRSAADGETWLTWDPFVNVVTGTQPACGVIDWINVYGDRSLTATRDRSAWQRFHVEPSDLVACLEADPSIRIGRGFWSTFYLDDEVRAYLEDQPESRFVSLHGF